MDDEIKDAIYMIEGEPALSLVKAHIADVRRVHEETRALAMEYGAETISRDKMNGVLLGVGFGAAERHADFKAPNRKNGLCYPKQKTAAWTRFRAQGGHANQEDTIAKAFGVPLSLTHKGPRGEGWTCIGGMLNACGFLYFGADGPYALYIPDVQAHINYYLSRGETVEQTFDMNLPGCRRILHEEWDLMVAEHKLKQKLSGPTPAPAA
jgi:hypothetical protein